MMCLCLITFALLLSAQTPGVNAWQVERNTICKSVDSDNMPVDETTSFLDTDGCALIWTKIQKDIPENLYCRDEIYAPDGTVDNFEWVFPEEDDIAWITFRFMGYTAGELPGTWNIKRYIENTLIFDENFTITYTRPKLRLVDKSSFEGITFYPGDIISYTFTLQNIGAAPAAQVELVVESITPENGLSLVESTLPKDLAVGAHDNWTLKLKVEEPGTYSISTYFENFYGLENFMGENYVYITGVDLGGDLADYIIYLDVETITASSVPAPQPEPFPWWILALVASIVIIAVVVLFKKGRKARR